MLRDKWSSKRPAVALLLATCLSTPAFAQSVAPEEGGGDDSNEIVVTANYRKQSVQDVPSGIQVYGGEALEKLGASGFENYLLTVPGASFRDQGSGNKRVAIRSISNMSATDFGGVTSLSTVGVYLNDVPIQGLSVLPDIALYDMNRVEVLKGPQGTLYGDGAMGGAIKMILNRPDPSGFSGKASVTASQTKSGKLDTLANAAINLPLVTDRVAIRVVGGFRDDNGYIDNVVTGQNNINSVDAYSVRATLLANLSDAFSVEALALRDVSNVEEPTQVNLTLADLKFNGLEDRHNDYKTDLYALTLRYDMGFAELTSVTSKYKRVQDQIDRSDFGLVAGLTNVPYNLDETLRSFAQEVRLVSSGDNRLDWVIGGIYRNKRRFSDFQFFVSDQDLPLIDPALRAQLPASNEYHGQFISDRYRQLAFYGQANFELAKGLDFTAGIRWYNDKVDATVTPDSLLFALATQQFDRSESGTTLKFGLSYKASDNVLLYANAAQGYRSSVPNINADYVGPDFAGPEDLWNFEAGIKTQTADKVLQFNAAAYYIPWSKFQVIVQEFVPLFGIPLGFITNGGDAKIYGFELEFLARPSDNFTAGATLGYAHSEVTRGEGDLTTGKPLPNSPRWTWSAFAEYRAPLSDSLEAFLRGDLSFVDRQASLAFTTAQPTGEMLQSYAMANLRLGLDHKNWGLDLFVNNLFDERAQLGRGLGGFGNVLDSNRFTIARPRTFGATVRVNY